MEGEIDSIARSLTIADLFRTYQPRAPRSLGQLQPLVVWEQGERRFYLQNTAVAETEVNALVNSAMLRGNLLARGDFDSLPIPFRAVAADLADRSVVVFRSGDLTRAVRASFTVPLVFGWGSARTPRWPVRFDYGISGEGRNAFFVRRGRWF